MREGPLGRTAIGRRHGKPRCVGEDRRSPRELGKKEKIEKRYKKSIKKKDNIVIYLFIYFSSSWEVVVPNGLTKRKIHSQFFNLV